MRTIKGALFGLLALLVTGGIAAFAGAIVHVASAAPDAATTVIHYKLVGSDEGAVGPDGRKHDTFRALDPTTVKVGQTVTISVTNYDDMPHGMAFPDLNVNKMIPAGKEGQPSVTTFNLTLTRAGSFRWYCPVPCDGDNKLWAMTPDAAGKGMDQDQFMAGYLTAA
jgi:heme/copper-type cytochrome/quinol oxidase subunit 2